MKAIRLMLMIGCILMLTQCVAPMVEGVYDELKYIVTLPKVKYDEYQENKHHTL